MSKYAQVVYINDYKGQTINLTLEYIKNKLKHLDKLPTYEYKIPSTMKIKRGDFCLVDANSTLNVVCVVKITQESQYNGLVKRIYSKLDLKPYQDDVEREQRLIILEQKINETYKKVSKLQVLRTVAKDNKELQSLLDEYEKLGEYI